MADYACDQCGGTNTVYQVMSGGTEYYCPDCENQQRYTTDGGVPSRVKLLRTPEGRARLRQEIDDTPASTLRTYGTYGEWITEDVPEPPVAE